MDQVKLWLLKMQRKVERAEEWAIYRLLDRLPDMTIKSYVHEKMNMVDCDDIPEYLGECRMIRGDAYQ